MSDLPPDLAALLDEQARYYRERAAEYDDWWLRRGRYDRGSAATAAWRDEVLRARAALDAFAPQGDVLELAAGTGTWTERLARNARSITVVDASPEMLALNRGRHEAACRARGVQYEAVLADLFTWRPSRRHDVVAFGFWLSHVPEPLLAPFWDAVRAACAPGGRVFFVDSLPDDESTAKDHVLPEIGSGLATRRLDDGRTFRIVKRFDEPAELTARLRGLGFEADVRTTGRFFLVGQARPMDGFSPP